MQLAFSEYSLSDDDKKSFRDWLGLNYDALTWQGKYQDEFNLFWDLFFKSGLSLQKLMDRFEFAQHVARVGPLVSWFDWLRSKFIIYIFIFKNASIAELSVLCALPPTEIGHILRSYLVECYPRLDDSLSDIFQVSHVTSANLNVTMEQVLKHVQIPKQIPGSHDDEIMPSMEVTLYEEWGILLEKLKREKDQDDLDPTLIKRKFELAKQWKTLKEILILTLIIVLAAFGVKKLNTMYEEFLIEKISIYEPQFQWLDRSLIFKSVDETSVAEFNLDVKDLDDVVDVAGSLNLIDEEERFDPESEVILTSWDALPRDFNVASLEVSSFEELSSGGYRDTRFGRTKVYRVMMKSVDVRKARDQLNQLLPTYNVTQADNVKPGLVVPGGLYYNLYVPIENLKEFLAQIMEVDDAVLYESRTRAGRNPPGQNKVFIWVKSI